MAMAAKIQMSRKTVNMKAKTVRNRKTSKETKEGLVGVASASTASVPRFPGVLPSSRKAVVDIRMVTPMDVTGLLGELDDITKGMLPAELALVDAYAEDMREGRWVLNGQAIVFEILSPGKWRIVNGLKRLLAVHKSRTSVPFVFVVFGADAVGAKAWSLEASIDAHRMRRSADYLSMLERNRAKTLSAALVHVFSWRNGGWQRGTPNTQDILGLFQGLPEIKESAETVTSAYKAIPGPLPLLIGFHAMLSRVSAIQTEEFFSGMAMFNQLAQRDPRRVLATKLAAISDGGAQATRQELHAFFAKAWNAYRAGAKISALRLGPSEDMPELDGWREKSASLAVRHIPDRMVRLFDIKKASTLEGVRASLVTVTQEGARSLLEHNTWNRNPSKATVNKFGRDMREGRWIFNGSSIVVSDQGRLLDGQQRLMALAEVGVPQDFVLVEGIHEAAFATIDGNRTRGFSRLLERKEVPYFKSAAAAVNILWRIEHGKFMSSDMPSIGEMLDTFQMHERGLREAARAYGVDASGLTPAVAIALRYLFDLEDPAKAQKFFEKLSGVGEFKEGDPVLALQRRLVKNRLGGEVGKAPPAERLLWGLSAWRDFRAGRSSRGLRAFKSLNEILEPAVELLAKVRRGESVDHNKKKGRG